MKRRVLAAIVFLSVAWPTASVLVRLAGEGMTLHRLALRVRRQQRFPGFYAGMLHVLRSVPPNERLALVTRIDRQGESDLAAFFNYYAYPHPTRTFIGLHAYALAANDPKRPTTIVGFNPSPHLTTYAALRAEAMGGRRVVLDMPLPAESRREWIVPFVCSIDGPPPDVYTIEAIVGADGPANVDVTFYPSGVTRRLVVSGTRTFHDLLYESSGTMGLGWMRIVSDVPIRAAFWFVNRGTRSATPLRTLDALPPLPLRFPPRPGARLWLLNPHDEPVVALAGGVQARIPPRFIIPMGPETVVNAPRPIFAFLSEKQPDGGTRFTWPEGMP